MKKLVLSLFLLLGAFQATFSNSIENADQESAPYLFDFQKYEHNPNVRLYKPEDYNQARNVLNENNLGFELGYEGYATLVYEKEDKILGVCIFEFETGYVQRLSVSKVYQGQGVGKALLHEVMHTLYSKYNIKRVCLYSLATAVNFYKKLGFQFQGQDASLQFA